jgi:hypothetical protein
MGLLFFTFLKNSIFLTVIHSLRIAILMPIGEKPSLQCFFIASVCPVPAVASLLSFLASVGAVLQLLFCLNSCVLAVGFYFLFHIL